MNLKEHYKTLYTDSISKIVSENNEFDTLIDSKLDQRFGITLLIRPSSEVKNKIQAFLSELKKVEPNQYYYPSSDIHVTVMSIISCYEGFDIKKIEVPKYIDLIQECILENNNSTIQFNGLTASTSCIMLQGYTNNDLINKIRDKLRDTFKNAEIEQSLDTRYTIQTAHSTIIRFKKELENKDAFLKVIDKYAEYNFGTFKVSQLELVYNDWYQRKKNIKKIQLFKI